MAKAERVARWKQSRRRGREPPAKQIKGNGRGLRPAETIIPFLDDHDAYMNSAVETKKFSIQNTNARYLRRRRESCAETGGQANATEADLHKSKLHILQFAPEILLIVAKYLTLKELFYFSRTCHHMHNLEKGLFGGRGHDLLPWAASKGMRRLAEIAITEVKIINVNYERFVWEALERAIHNYIPIRDKPIDFEGTADVLLRHTGLYDRTKGIAMLRTAIERNLGLVVNRLLQSYPDAINTVFHNDHTPLTTAILWRCSPELLKILIDGKADVNQQNGFSRTALALAIHRCQLDAAQFLLEQPDIDLTDKGNGVPVFEGAIENGVYPVIKRLLQDCKDRQAYVNTPFNNGHTPLTTAILWRSRCSPELLKILIDGEADVNQQNGFGRTALALAIHTCQLDAAQFLLEQPDIDLTDKGNGIPVFERAIEKGVYPVVKRLLQDCKDRQAYVNTPSNNGQTPLVTAAQCGRAKILGLLVDSGADVNQRCEHATSLDSTSSIGGRHDSGTGQDWTALAIAARHGHENIVQQLLRCKNIQTGLFSTDAGDAGDAVYWAAVQGHFNCVLILLQSSQVSYSAEQIDGLLDKVKRMKSRRAGYTIIYKLLTACRGTNSPESRQAKLKDLTPKNLRAAAQELDVQAVLELF